MDKGFKMSARRGRSGAWKGVGGVFGVFESVGSGKGWQPNVGDCGVVFEGIGSWVVE